MKVKINKRNAEVVTPERITSGSVGMVVECEFTEEWAGLSKTAVFTDFGSNSYDVLESAWSGNSITIPHEVMASAGNIVWMGVYGVNVAGTVVIPTVYCKLGMVKLGADPSGDESTDPTLPVWSQIQTQVHNNADAIAAEALARASADARAVKTVNGQAPDSAGNVNVAGGGGTGAWADITGKPDTFPPSAHTHSQSDVTGLVAALSGKQDTIADLAAIRAGATAGATALQAVPNTYRTAAQQDAVHDSTKQDTIADLATIRAGAAAGATAVQPVAGKRLVSDDDITALAAGVVPTDDITANTDARHTHANKTVLDGITADKVAQWDAGGGGSVGDFELINSVTVTEELQKVDFTQDSNGNAFALKKCVVLMSWVTIEAGTSTICYFAIGGNGFQAKYANKMIYIQKGAGNAAGKVCYAMFTAENEIRGSGENFWTATAAKSANETSANSGVYPSKSDWVKQAGLSENNNLNPISTELGIYRQIIDNIESVSLGTYTGVTFGVGTEIRLYGVRA